MPYSLYSYRVNVRNGAGTGLGHWQDIRTGQSSKLNIRIEQNTQEYIYSQLANNNKQYVKQIDPTFVRSNSGCCIMAKNAIVILTLIKKLSV